MADPNTTELLKQILLELKTLNQNLELDRGARKKYAALSEVAAGDEDGVTGPESSSNIRVAEEILSEGSTDTGLCTETTQSPGEEMAAETRAQDPVDDALPPESGETQDGSTADEINDNPSGCWKVPYYGSDDGENGSWPSEDQKRRWGEILGTEWALPPDNRLPLTLCADYLQSGSDEDTTATLNEVDGYIKELAQGPAFSRFTITDHLGGGRKYKYFAGHFRDARAHLIRALHTSLATRAHQISYELDTDTGQGIDEPVTAHWRRFIEIRGLCAIPRVRIRSVFPWLWRPHGAPSVGMHLYDHVDLRPTPWSIDKFAELQLVFYEIVGPTSNHDITKAFWEAGPLHSDRQRGFSNFVYDKSSPVDAWNEPAALARYLRKSAFTIIGIHGKFMLPHAWTIVALTPETWAGRPAADLYTERPDATVTELSLLETMLDLAVDGIDELCDRVYGDLLAHFDDILSGKEAVLDPEYHDSLLSDNENFSRSKTFFWAINTIREINEGLTQTIENLHDCAKSWPNVWSSDRAERQAQGDRIRLRLGPSIEKLERIQKKFMVVRDEATALRDGLFNASAVMESRASTRLGENVKLLTFVSIFFLPLSFCMSLWSINNDLFSLQALGITSAFVALATYLIVFNVNNISQGVSSIYNLFAARLISKMETGDETKWRDRANAFKTFGKAGKIVTDDIVLPSKWRLVQYVVRRPWTATVAVWRRLFPNARENSTDEQSEHTPDASESESTSESNTGIETPGDGTPSLKNGTSMPVRLLQLMRFWRKKAQAINEV